MFSCDDSDIDTNSELGTIENDDLVTGPMTFNNIADIEQLGLQARYDIDQNVYEEFLNSVILENGHLRGAVIDGIENTLNEEDAFNFWSTFGVMLEFNKLSAEDATEIRTMNTFPGFKPKGPRGSNQNRRWVCHLPGDVMEFIRQDGINSRSELLQAQLNLKFDIPFPVYKEFVESVVFEDGKIRGFIYDKLYKYLTSAEMTQLHNLIKIGDDPIYVSGHKPVGPNNCKKNIRWICLQH